MKYQDVLSMSRNCPKCCKGAMERLTKYKPERNISLEDTKKSETHIPAEAPEEIKEETIKKEEAQVPDNRPVEKPSHKNRRCRKQWYFHY